MKSMNAEGETNRCHAINFFSSSLMEVNMKRKTKKHAHGFLGVVTALVLMGTPGLVEAANLSGDVSTDSRIELVDQPGEGPDRVISIMMSTKLGESTIIINKDGKISEAVMSSEECFNLWQYLLKRDIGNMVDAPVKDPIPDQSVFIFTFTNGSETNTFSAYGVDFLEDTRYREIARAIIEIAETYSDQGEG